MLASCLSSANATGVDILVRVSAASSLAFLVANDWPVDGSTNGLRGGGVDAPGALVGTSIVFYEDWLGCRGCG